jgi:hypothetical protein
MRSKFISEKEKGRGLFPNLYSLVLNAPGVSPSDSEAAVFTVDVD